MPEVGRTAPEETHTQSVCFYKEAGWTEASSRKWCEEHDYYTDGLDETDILYRWRQYDPDDSKFRYRNQEIEEDSIFLVIGYLKAGDEGDEEAGDKGKGIGEEEEGNGQSALGNRKKRKEPQMSTDKHRLEKEPMRCFEGDAKPHEPFWKWRNVPIPDPSSSDDEEGEEPSPAPVNTGEGEQEEGSEPEMELYGYISEYSWYEDDVTPKMFKKDLMRYGKGGPITIRMNSYGGDVIAASVMSTILRDYPGRVTVQVDGVAASAATVVAVAGDRVRMMDTAYFMIHDPLVFFFLAMLNIEELTRLANSLQAVKEGIVNTYETKTGLSRARLAKMMTDETWMDAKRAVDLGFADEVLTKGKKGKGKGDAPTGTSLPGNTAMINCLKNYRNVPAELWEAIEGRSGKIASPQPERNIPEAAESSEPLTDNQKHEAEALRIRIQKILRKD